MVTKREIANLEKKIADSTIPSASKRFALDNTQFANSSRRIRNLAGTFSGLVGAFGVGLDIYQAVLDSSPHTAVSDILMYGVSAIFLVQAIGLGGLAGFSNEDARSSINFVQRYLERQ